MLMMWIVLKCNNAAFLTLTILKTCLMEYDLAYCMLSEREEKLLLVSGVNFFYRGEMVGIFCFT